MKNIYKKLGLTQKYINIVEANAAEAVYWEKKQDNFKKEYEKNILEILKNDGYEI